MTVISQHASQVAEKSIESEKIRIATEKFLASGREIEEVDSSVFGDKTLPTCSTMRHRSHESEKSKRAGLNKTHQSTHRRRSKKNNSDIFGSNGKED